MKTTCSRAKGLAYNANRYIVPHHVVGKRILLKIKDGTIRFFHDDELLATYREPDGKHQLVGTLMRKLKETESKRKAYLTSALVVVDEVGYLPVDSKEEG